jgi:hypothetical protein
MKTLQIRWQRLVDERGKTCDRCGATESEVEKAVQKLKTSLDGLGIAVTLEKEALGPSEFSKDTLQSNRIWIGGEPIEKWLSAESGKSKCCSTCGDADCRTLTVGGKTYEAIPSELIVKAGLLAGAKLLDTAPEGPCCPEPAAKPAGPKPCGPTPCKGK